MDGLILTHPTQLDNYNILPSFDMGYSKDGKKGYCGSVGSLILEFVVRGFFLMGSGISVLSELD